MITAEPPFPPPPGTTQQRNLSVLDNSGSPRDGPTEALTYLPSPCTQCSTMITAWWAPQAPHDGLNICFGHLLQPQRQPNNSSHLAAIPWDAVQRNSHCMVPHPETT